MAITCLVILKARCPFLLALIQSKHPGVRVMSRDEAIRLNIIPPPPPPPPEPDSDPEHEAEMEPEREDGLDTNLDIGDTSARDRPTHVDQNQHVVTIPMQTLNESAVPTLPQSRRTRPLGVAATPPVAVVQGKPMQGNRPRYANAFHFRFRGGSRNSWRGGGQGPWKGRSVGMSKLIRQKK